MEVAARIPVSSKSQLLLPDIKNVGNILAGPTDNGP